MHIGIVGGHGHHYLRHLRENPIDGTPVQFGVCGDGHDDARAVALCKTMPGARWFDSLNQLIAVHKPDVVSVGAVYGYNGDLVAQALVFDVPVVSDKPIAANWKQLETLQILTDGTRRRVITEFPFRTQREFLATRDVVLRGGVGKVALITAQKSYRFGTRPAWYADRNAYGGTLLWIASHAIDVVPFVTGQRVTRVTGTGGNVTRDAYGTMEDHVTVTMQLDGGASAVIHADFLRPTAAPSHGDDRLRVAGATGVVEVRDERCRLITDTQGETDITDSVPVPQHTAEQLLRAALGETGVFSTEHSLHTASLLLKCRDAVDGAVWLDV